ncbi:MAG: DNA primase small subunit domain-containing protein [Promethearchaeota archaeon]
MKNAITKKAFTNYYKRISGEMIAPPELSAREIAMVLWEYKGMTRHLGFPNNAALKQYIEQKGPKHLYYSAAVYISPSAPKMNQKGHQGCDLIFDIDCDHIDTPCKMEHDRWFCTTCNDKSGMGLHPDKCPKCGGTSFRVENWLCDTCLEKSKTETIKLVNDFLLDDFGIKPEHLKIYFSGNRGYHVHVENEAYRQLGSDERREIADYITATGISLDYLGFTTIAKGIRGFTLRDTGWREKIAKGILNFIDALQKNQEKIYKEKTSIVVEKLLLKNVDILRKRIQSGNRNWTLESIGPGYWNRIIKRVIDDVKCEIDVPVTIDTHRLIRAPNSLHGGTGFRVMEISRDHINDFDPFKDPVVFDDHEIKVKIISDTPKFRIKDQKYGPFQEGEFLQLPFNAAVFLECKNKGEIV